MKRVFIFLIAILWIIMNQSVVMAQKGGRQSQINTSISEKTRKESSLIADALREFYSNNYSTAEENFRRVIELNPKNDVVYYLLGKCNLATKKAAEAVYYYSEAVKLNKSNIWYKYELSQAYQMAGDFKNAAKYLELVCKEKNQNEYYIYELANCYLELKQLPKVIEMYNRMEALIGYNKQLTEAKRDIYLYINDINNAVGEYDKLIENYPYEIEFYLSAAQIYISNNIPNKAYEYYQRAEKIKPNDAQLILALVNYYKNYQDFDAYQNQLRILFESMDIEYTYKYMILEKLQAEALNSKDKAHIADLLPLGETLVKKHPQEMSGLLLLACIQSINQQYSEAKSNFEKLVDVFPNSTSFWENYLMVLNMTQDYHTIDRYAETIAEIFPTNSKLLLCLGTACNQEKNWEKALTYLRQAATYAFENIIQAEIQYEMGNAYQIQGNLPEAKHYWEIAKKKGKQGKEIERKLKEVE